MKLLTTFALASALIVSSAHSATLIQDFFSRSGNLAGSNAVPTTSGPWGGGGYTTDGNSAVVALNPSAGGYCFQTIGPLQPSSSYVLSVYMENTGGGDEWLGMGFGGNVGNGYSVLIRGTGDAVAFEGGAGLPTIPPVAGVTKGFFSIKLDTGASLNTSTISYFRDGGSTQIGTTHLVDASSIDRVFIQDIANVTGIYDNFFLTGPAVPEPSSLLLLSIAGLGLVRRRR